MVVIIVATCRCRHCRCVTCVVNLPSLLLIIYTVAVLADRVIAPSSSVVASSSRRINADYVVVGNSLTRHRRASSSRRRVAVVVSWSHRRGRVVVAL